MPSEPKYKAGDVIKFIDTSKYDSLHGMFCKILEVDEASNIYTFKKLSKNPVPDPCFDPRSYYFVGIPILDENSKAKKVKNPELIEKLYGE